MITAAPQFDICGELPTGVTVLEASAGTGKTYAIAALATRYVAEGIPLEKLLLVTFTILATGELRDRVRERLVSAEHGLERVLAGGEVRGDAVVELLARGERDHVTLRRERLALAIADFDSATIATTHSFCQEMLGGLGIIGDVEPDTVFVEDIDDLVEEVVDDLYVRKFIRGGSQDMDRAEALAIARLAVANATVPIEPADAPAGTIAAMRVSLARAVIKEVEARKRRLTVTTYDDWLTRLNNTLKGPNSEEAAERLRKRYKVVLVDEFQDTDPVQWDILRRAFGEPGSGTTLVLIGDPKQAIYAFRGADVYAYIEAKGGAKVESLGTNYRSDQGLIDAYDALLRGAQLGHQQIVYSEVRAAPGRAEHTLGGAPLRVRILHNDEPGLEFTPSGYARVGPAREHVAADLAADVVRLLESGATLPGGVPVKPGHIAVLVRTHRNAAMVRDALEAVHVPAVINGAGSVFGTAPARDWLRLLEAIERPTSQPRARSAALTPFLGWSAERVAAADDDAWEEVHRRLHHWARVLRLRGVASLTETITLIEGLPKRVLEQVEGERRMTDLRHIGQLLHAAAATEGMGPAALTAWLRRRIDEAETDTSDEERSRRLESDADAVQVLTIHRSKGLEFPVVYYPYLWEPTFIPKEAEPLFFHDPANGDVRTLDVGLEGPDWARHRELYEAEQRGEDLRLAYVALTRAQHQAVVWWASAWAARDSALARLLFSREPDGYIQPKGRFTPTPEKFQEKLESLGSAQISIERASFAADREPWQGDAEATAAMSARRFDRSLDWGWRRTSYSDITAGAHDARVASEPEDVGVADEPDGVAAVVVERPPADAPAVPLGIMPAGAQIGTFVHRVFEAADFAAADLDVELTAQIAAAQARGNVDIGDSALVVAGLRAVLETPLGELTGGARLCDFARTDRLDELTFELPLAGGDDPTGRVTLEAIAGTLRSHGALSSYADRLSDPALRTQFSGYLTGSIDLVARVDGARFVVVDYKTNWLAGPGDVLTAWHHRPAALAAEMERAHYHLQALLYLTALHRYLRWRLPGYDPEVNLAGVLYLFMRGMTGGDGGSGIYSWRPPAGLVPALSDALEGA